MKKNALTLASLLLGLLAFGLVRGGSDFGDVAPRQTKPVPDFPARMKTGLVRYLETRAQTPEDYVVSRFESHDLVFLGEHHYIKHDVEFVQGLIPLLYEAGVRDLGIEFGCHELQDRADALLAADAYDEDLARRLMFQWGTYWGYVEYLGLYRKAWELNASLPPEAPKFRIVGLDYHARWDLLEEDMTTAKWKKVLHKGPRDEHMARVAIEEFVGRNRKALIYAGAHHACTRFHVPEFDPALKRVVGVNRRSMGNIVHQQNRGRTFFIILHYPWDMVRGEPAYDYPVGGLVDRVWREAGSKRAGFDVRGSPFGRLRDRASVYAAAGKPFTFGDLCDGYIIQKPFSGYEGCSVDPLFITEENFAEAVSFLPRADFRSRIKTRLQLLENRRWEADFRRRYPDLE